MIEIKNLAYNAVVYGIGNGLSRFASLLALPFLTRYISPSDYAIISLATLMCAVLRIGFGVGSNGAAGIEYFKTEDQDDRQNVIVALLAIALISSLLMLAGGYLFSHQLADLMFGSADSSKSRIVEISLVTLAFQLLADPLLQRLQFEKMSNTFVAVTAIGNTGGVALSIILVIVFGLGVWGLFIGQLIAAIVVLLVLIFVNAPRMINLQKARRVSRNIISLAVPLIPGAMAVVFIQQAGLFFVKRDAGLHEAGLFSVGYQLGLLISLLTAAFASAWMPFFQSYVPRQNEAALVFERVAMLYLAVLGTITLAFFGFSRLAVELLTGPEFHEAWAFVGIFTLGQFYLGFWGILLPGLYFARRTSLISAIHIVSAAAALIATPLLLHAWGPIGAALAQTFGFLLLVVLQALVNLWLKLEVSYISGWSVACLVATTILGAIILKIIAANSTIVGALWSALVLAIYALVTASVCYRAWQRTPVSA